MVTKNVVRTLGVLVGVSSLIIACQPDEGASVQTRGGLEAQCNPLVEKGCTIGDTSDPKGGGEDKGSPEPTISHCDPVSVEAIHNAKDQKFFGNTRLVEVIEGKVACLNYDLDDKATIEACMFTKDIADANGFTYVIGKGARTNTFAIAGTSVVGPDGKPGPWVVAQRVTATKTLDRKTKTYTTRYSVPCLPPQGADMAATPAGTELGGACVVETINATTNVTTRDHLNFCKLEVCARKDSNTDAVEPGTPKTSGVSCWKGAGAALNDPNGIERDPNGIYYPGVEFCHRAWLPNGDNYYETAAAKRPTTTGGKVLETSPIRWLPLAPGVVIGNP